MDVKSILQAQETCVTDVLRNSVVCWMEL